MRNGTVEIADRGEGTAQMTMAFGPVRRERQQPLVSGCRFFMLIAVAEQPGAEMRGIPIVRGERKGAAAAFESVVAATIMEQRLGQPAIQ
jgi:hypothetical protein